MRKMSDSEWESDEFLIKKGDEDIHTANERRLSEIIGSEIGNWKLIYCFLFLFPSGKTAHGKEQKRAGASRRPFVAQERVKIQNL